MSKKETKNLLTRALLLGFGLMDVTKEEIGKSIKELKKDRNISKKKSEKAVKDFFGGIDKNKEEVRKIMRKQIKRMINELGLATKEDIKRLKKK